MCEKGERPSVVEDLTILRIEDLGKSRGWALTRLVLADESEQLIGWRNFWRWRGEGGGKQ